MSPSFNVATYVDVQTRINRFWEEHPNGRIETQMMSLPDDFDQVVFKASVYTQVTDNNPSATGWAAEVATPNQRGANQTSWHENAETSAIGRALANMGYAKTAEDRPSREEMDKVTRGPAAREVVNGQRTGRGGGPVDEDVVVEGAVMANPGQMLAIEKLWGIVRPAIELPDVEFTHRQAADLIRDLEREKKEMSVKG
jgi:hypothetical protein